MPHYPNLRIIHFQSLQQLQQSIFLLGSSGIGRPPPYIETSFITDTDAMSIIAGGVCSHDVKRSSGMNHPVAGDVVVIADVGKATGTVVTTAVVHGVTLRGAGGTTMNHDQVDVPVVLVLAAV